MAGTDYEEVDVARIRAVLDATLATTIGSTLTFGGFFGPGETIPETEQQPVYVDDGNPRGSVTWHPDYANVEDFLSGGKREREMAIRFHVRRQPDPPGVATVYSDVMAVKRAICDKFRADAPANGLTPGAEGGLFSRGLVDGWPEWGFFQPAFAA